MSETGPIGLVGGFNPFEKYYSIVKLDHLHMGKNNRYFFQRSPRISMVCPRDFFRNKIFPQKSPAEKLMKHEFWAKTPPKTNG